MSDGETDSILGIAARDLARLRTVAAIVVRHGFGELLLRSALGRRLLPSGPGAGDGDVALKDVPAPERFRRLLESLGPTWIKLGQILASRPDRVPRAWIDALQSLQDQVQPVPFELIREAIEAGLGVPLSEAFAEVEVKPLGTASIAQTHRARLKDGRQVVVKVQRPGVSEVMRRDLDLLYIGARLLEASIEEMSLYEPAQAVVELEKALVRELDFTGELRNLEEARALLDPERAVVIPAPHPDHSCRTVLTMDYFAGRPAKAIPQGSDLGCAVAAEIVHAACKQVLIDGFFHGDPHGGNILVGENGVVCMIDVGLMGRLTPLQQEHLLSLVFAAMTGDVDGIARVLLVMGRPTRRVQMAEFKAEIARIRQTYLAVGDLNNFDVGGFLREFVEAAQRFRIKLAPEYAVLVKAAVTIEGVGRALDPAVDILGIARPYVETRMRDRLNPQRMMQDAFSGAGQIGSLLQHLPGQLDQILHDVETGNVQVRAVSPAADAMAESLHTIARRMVLVGFASTMSICAALLLPNDPTRVGGIPLLSTFCIVMAVLFWTVLLGRSVLGDGGPLRLGPLLSLFRRP